MSRVEEIKTKLSQDGYVVIQDYLANNPARDTFFREVNDTIINSKDTTYKFGKAERIGSLQESAKTRKGTFQCFTTPLLEELKRDTLQCQFTEIFVTHEFSHDRGLERNGYLHFDRIWTFKYFYYITDVTRKEQGPLCVVPKTNLKGKELRNLQKGKPYGQQLNRIKIDYPDLYEEIRENITPIYGPAGTLIIFDTDTFHMGGVVSEGFERKVCRLHMR